MGLRGSVWDRMYRRDPSWELGGPDPVLVAALDGRAEGRGRALDIGCGTGDNAIALARHGYAVVGIDLAPRAIARAREKAAVAGQAVDLRVGDVLDDAALTGPFDLIVDRGLLMSLFGERARRRYVDALRRLVAPDGVVYQHQWALVDDPVAFSRQRVVVAVRGIVVAPREIERRFGSAFDIEVLDRRVEDPADRGFHRLGIDEVAKTSWWLTRRPVAD